METYRRDLAKAGIPYLDEQGRRVDFHSLRLTFGTNLVLSGAHPRVVQELMRHSDIRLTMKLYTDVSKLPMREAVAASCRANSAPSPAEAPVISAVDFESVKEGFMAL